MVTVRGCYSRGFERVLLWPCTEPRRDELAWVTSRKQLEETARAVPGFREGALAYERPSARERDLDLQLLKLPTGAIAEVDLRGELHTSSGFDYGIEPGYRHEFVVHRVLRVVPQAARTE